MIFCIKFLHRNKGTREPGPQFIISAPAPGGNPISAPRLRFHTTADGCTHRVHIFTRDETGLVCLPQCPLSWSVHCNFTGDGKCNERGLACTPHPHQPGLILPSWWNVRQKAAVATLCTLWLYLSRAVLLCPALYSLQCEGGPVPAIVAGSVNMQHWMPSWTIKN